MNCLRASGSCWAWLLKRLGGDQEMVNVLALVLLLDEQRVVGDITEALKCGINLQAVCA
jgi:hypothetical protein